MRHRYLSEECFEANRALHAYGLAELTLGSVSVFDPAMQVFAIKPNAVPYEKLVPDDIVMLNLEGTVIFGTREPSTDEPTHRFLYNHLVERGVRSIAHTHSLNAVAFAQADLPIPCLGTTHSDFFNGDVPISRELTEEEVSVNYAEEIGKTILERIDTENLFDIPAVLIRHHGPYLFGESSAKTLEYARAIEIAASMAIKTLALDPTATGPASYLRQMHRDRMRQAPARERGR